MTPSSLPLNAFLYSSVFSNFFDLKHNHDDKVRITTFFFFFFFYNNLSENQLLTYKSSTSHEEAVSIDPYTLIICAHFEISHNLLKTSTFIAP